MPRAGWIVPRPARIVPVFGGAKGLIWRDRTRIIFVAIALGVGACACAMLQRKKKGDQREMEEAMEPLA